MRYLVACMHSSLGTEDSRDLLGTGFNSLPLSLTHSHTHTFLHSLKQLRTHLNICTTDSSYFKAKKDILYFLKLNNYTPTEGFLNCHVLFLSCHGHQNKYIHRTISIHYAPIWWTDFMVLCNADKHFISLLCFFFSLLLFFVAKHYDLPKNIQRSFSGKLHNLLTVLLFLVAQYDLWTEFKVI